ncbi:MAG: hypothetical protein K6G51_01875 [Sphaerochaetaceae bacterium]|nr:hypothetical protein [Sphaerochaetaceae bacterium]
MSKCKEKYGKEWSESINESTRDYFEDMPFGTVKHILDKGSRYVLSRGMFYASKHKLQVPESLWNKKVFLFTYIDGYPAQMPRLIKFDIAYDSIEDMIDDGWALD